MLLHSNKTTCLITSLFFSLFKDREEGAVKMGERTREQVLFLWLTPSIEEEVKTFSFLITCETTRRHNESGQYVCFVCVHEVIKRQDCVRQRF